MVRSMMTQQHFFDNIFEFGIRPRILGLLTEGDRVLCHGHDLHFPASWGPSRALPAPCDVHATRSSHVSARGLCDIWPCQATPRAATSQSRTCQASPPSLTLWLAPRLFCQLHRPPGWPPELYLFCSLVLVFWKWISAQRTTFPWACQGRSVTGSQPFAINA